METEGSLSYSEDPATESYPEHIQCSSLLHIAFRYDPF
jgi:hypothetical protein